LGAELPELSASQLAPEDGLILVTDAEHRVNVLRRVDQYWFAAPGGQNDRLIPSTRGAHSIDGSILSGNKHFQHF
jgi:hypothetical protein